MGKKAPGIGLVVRVRVWWGAICFGSTVVYRYHSIKKGVSHRPHRERYSRKDTTLFRVGTNFDLFYGGYPPEKRNKL